MIEIANNNLLKSGKNYIEFRVMNNLNMDTPDDYFDLVVARHTCIDAKQIYKTLKKHGKLLLRGVVIMKAFIEIRKFLMINGQIFERLTSVEYKKIDEVFNQLQLEDTVKQRIFFDGQIYDAYSLIIDNYIDDSILKMLTKKKNNVEVVIIT